MSNKTETLYNVKAGNIRRGTTKSGNPYVRVGLVIKGGPRDGEWLNYMLIKTPKSAPRVNRDLELMGITELEPFTCDGRLFTAVWGYSEFWKEDQVIAVRAGTTKTEDVVVQENPF